MQRENKKNKNKTMRKTSAIYYYYYCNYYYYYYNNTPIIFLVRLSAYKINPPTNDTEMIQEESGGFSIFYFFFFLFVFLFFSKRLCQRIICLYVPRFYKKNNANRDNTKNIGSPVVHKGYK